MNAHPGAIRFVSSRLASAIRPAAPTPFARWLTENIILVDGPKKGEFWSPQDAPYLVEIAECLSQEHPSNLVTVRKAQQTGVSILALAWTLYLAETCPDNALYGVPGIDALQDINSGKMQPMIDAWQKKTGKRIIAPSTSRSGVGSTTYEKKFPGGAIYLANANTVMDLSAKTCRFGIKDEVSKWKELPNGADPETLFFGRFTAFRRQRSYKILELSTPELDSGDALGDDPGHCRIDRSFRRSDQRFWHIACPECQYEQVQKNENLNINREHPHKTTMRCINCDHEISEMERVQAVREGRFIPTFTGPDRHPGFHVDAFMSLMMSYGDIAEDAMNMEGKGEAGAKDYHNLVLALPYAMKGDAPDHVRLLERREVYPERMIPEGGLLLVAGADVQTYGIWLEVVVFGQDRQSWTVRAELLEGPTDNVQTGAWTLLEAALGDEYADEYGVLRKVEALAVDSGFRTNHVYEWCRRHPNTYAVKGQAGRGIPAITPPKKMSVNKRGKRKRHGSIMSWPVGTWALKAEFYGNLHKTGIAAGEPVDPPGYCHFGDWLGEEYFQQLTAEYFSQKLVKGKLHEEWIPRRQDNHFLDCRIYAMAMAEHLGLSRKRPAEWAALRAELAPALPPAAIESIQDTQGAMAEPDEVLQPVAQPENRWKRRR
ncbi:phage terminase large subunit family protein [Rhizobium sp. CFBP 8762]|uniref:terminase gpA endonuclease subunit n=1 Tax=Rhizobium sp. CFBP 8762 TaxID=2775279 RepID=UPI001781B68E|nr:terminase gpA endonuclease subunit [Rhizobium sp. CFBP 8762]MBD8555543.1 phage terminase large subunit family protein [Rhizobium sp. CFBP 8762]